MRYPLALLALIALTTGCQSAPTAEDRARAVLETELRDPASMQLRNVRFADNGGICGEVNARNSFGGYNGFTPFYISGGVVTIEGEGALPGAVADQCGGGPE